MPYLMLEDFAAGIDLRKSALTAPAGTLRDLQNATITAGGEIEKRKTFTLVGNAPANTVGLGFNPVTDQLVVWGTNEPGAVIGLPQYVSYQRLTGGPAGVAIDRILDSQWFNGAMYVVARYVNGVVKHHYNGAVVADAQAKGTSVRAFRSKLYAVEGVNLRSSGVLLPLNWSGETGASVIDVTTEDAERTELLGLERYYSALAVFGRNAIQVWEMDPDPAASFLGQVLGGTGLVAPNAVARYGSGDVLFLSDTGIRSLRARDVSDNASVNDIGAPLDNVIIPRRSVLTPALAEKLTSLVDPLTGHYWLFWGDEVFVLATYPQSKVSAWSRFTLTRMIDYASIARSRIVTRSGNEIFIYGSLPPGQNPFAATTPVGTSAAQYDASPVTLQTPLLDVGKPGTIKKWHALDVSCTGTWQVYVNPTPEVYEPAAAVPGVDTGTDDAPWLLVATITGQTWTTGSIPLEIESTHMQVRMVSTNTGPATVASMALHHDMGEAS